MRPISDLSIQQAKAFAMEIASAASNANQLCYYFAPDSGDTAHYEAQLQMMRDVVKRIGWLADECASKLGASTVVGDASAWMAPPGGGAPNGIAQA